jgi:hypothetical protein
LYYSARLQCNSLNIYRNKNACRCCRAAKHTVHIQRTYCLRFAVAGRFKTAKTLPPPPQGILTLSAYWLL